MGEEIDTLVIDVVASRVEWLGRPVFGEGAKDNTRGRVCSPWVLRTLP